jgi:hypothetical protein
MFGVRDFHGLVRSELKQIGISSLKSWSWIVASLALKYKEVL